MHENLTDFDSIKGFLDHEEGILLYKMAKKYCIKTFAVEIGSYCGKSACYIGMVIKKYSWKSQCSQTNAFSLANFPPTN